MFEITNITKYLSIISYIGFIISGISGFAEVAKDFNLCILMNSIVVICNILVVLYYDITEKIEEYINKEYYFRSFIQFIASFLVIGISPIGIGFGIYGIMLGFVNFFMGLFCIDTDTNNTQINTINTTNTNN